MRLWYLLSLLTAFSGCLEFVSETERAAPEPTPVPAAHYETAGRLWLPPSQGPERVRTALTLPLNVSGMTVAAELRLGSAYAGLELPTTMADVQVQLIDPEGKIAQEGLLGGGSTDLAFEHATTLAGEWSLVLLSHGGSDGEANGDHVDYEAHATSTRVVDP